MGAYYNEIDLFACDWLSNLMDAGLITPGKIDDRSIHDVRPDDLDGFERVHFFAGIGGWDHALNIAGWTGPVWTGSCPCQPFSLAGAQKGFDDSRHLWPELKRLIAERRPSKVFGEQVASATDWLRLVRSELEAMGYAVGAMPIQAASAGADHLRDRYWFVANANDKGLQGGVDSDPSPCDSGDVPNSQRIGVRSERPCTPAGATAGMQGADEQRERVWPDVGAVRDAGDLEWVLGADGKARRVKPGIRLLAHGIPNRVGLLRGFGNAIDPRPAAQFIKAAAEALTLPTPIGGSEA